MNTNTYTFPKFYMEENMKRIMLMAFVIVFVQGCATYKYADNVKMIAFGDNVKKGKSMGQIEGKDCTWNVLGYSLGGAPTLDKAFMNTQNQAGEAASAGFSTSEGKLAVKYMNNVTTERTGFNAFVVAKQCLVVKGAGYK